MRAEVEVRLCRMSDGVVDDGARRYVSPHSVLRVLHEEPRVVPFLYAEESYRRLVVILQLRAGLPHA